MSFIRGLNLISNAASVASGNVPLDLVLKLLPRLFKKKKLTKAQLKKLMMMRRRRFVDTVLMPAHKEAHQENLKNVIDQTKKKIKLQKDLALDSSVIKVDRWQSKVRPNPQSGKTRIKGFVENGERQRSRSRWATRSNDSSSQSI